MGYRTRLEIPVGSPAFEINRIAREADASLIVIGTHGESLAKEFLLGSVVHRLLQIAEKPVLLIPITILEGEGEEKTCDVLCGDFFRHPLFATDFSGSAERAFHSEKGSLERFKKGCIQIPLPLVCRSKNREGHEE